MQGGISPEVHDHLHCFEHVELQVVVTAPDSQLFNLQFVSRLVYILDEADDGSIICKYQELDSGVFCSTFVCIQGEERGGENTSLRGTSADDESPVACNTKPVSVFTQVSSRLVFGLKKMGWFFCHHGNLRYTATLLRSRFCSGLEIANPNCTNKL